MLSFAGRAILIQASSAAIRSYIMQCAKLPRRILDGLDQVNRNFLCGTTKTAKRIHWVGWQKVTRTKEEGGLGLQATKGRNTALLAKLNWRSHTEREALWAQVLWQKYHNNRRLNASNPDRLPCSQVWTAIKRGRETFKKGSLMMISRDSNVSFWRGNWLNKRLLWNLIQGPLSQGASQLEVKDVLTDTGWDWSKIPFELPLDVKSLIQAIPTTFTSRGRERISWMGNPKGTFDLRSAYSIAIGVEIDMVVSDFRWIWKLNTLPCIKTFLWMCAHGSIGVKTCLVRRRVVEEESYPICQRALETILHALRDCQKVKEVWRQLGIQRTDQVFWTSNLQDWIKNNSKDRGSCFQGNPPWNILFLVVVWNIWKSRNMLIFKRKSQNPNLSNEIMKQVVEFLCYVASPRNPTRVVIRSIRWEKPAMGWKKLNTDGSVFGSFGQVGCGGVVRDEHGNWIVGFTRHIGTTNFFAAEFWGLRDDLSLCLSLNIPCLVVEVDAKAVVDVPRNHNYDNIIISPIMDDCR